VARRAEQVDRRELLLREALRLVAHGGLQAVTHRAVERAARLPHGSVTYYFGSRDDLVLAMVDRLVDDCERAVAVIARDVAMALARSPGRERLDVDRAADALTAWMDEDHERHLARLELELAAARDPRLRRRMTDAALVFWRLCAPIALALGSEDPELDGRAMASMIDGLLIDRLAHEPADPRVIRVAVRRLLGSWTPSIAAPAESSATATSD
jgi:DNA-binding transcriptional regulator YbjK